MKMMKIKKINMKSLFNNNKFLQFLSVIIAIILWFIAANADGDDTTIVKNVPVQINLEESVLGRLGLDTISDEDYKVDVLIKGPSYIIGNIEPSDIDVDAMLNNITGPGSYDVKLEGKDKNNVGFTVELVRPSVIKLQFDRLITKKLTVETDITGISIPEGYVLESEIVSPKEITITGPESDVQKVYKAVVHTNAERTLDKTEVIKAKIEIQDKDGNIVESKFINLDNASVDVTIPVLKKKLIPVEIGFINVPPNFPLTELEYEFTNDYIEAAGPASVIDNMSVLHLGYVDVNSMDINGKYSFAVSLPVGFENLESINNIDLQFDTTNMIEKKFNVTNINVVNVPVNYSVTVTTKNISGVSMVGRKDIIDKLTSKDIVAEIDMSTIGEIRTGQVKVPVSVFAPNKGLVWANGEYQVIIDVKEK